MLTMYKPTQNLKELIFARLGINLSANCKACHILMMSNSPSFQPKKHQSVQNSKGVKIENES